MQDVLSIGDRVRIKPGKVHAYESTPWFEKLSKPRLGTVVGLPWAIRHEGTGTLQVHWDALTGDNTDPANWVMWTHTDFIEKAQ